MSKLNDAEGSVFFNKKIKNKKMKNAAPFSESQFSFTLTAVHRKLRGIIISDNNSGTRNKVHSSSFSGGSVVWS